MDSSTRSSFDPGDHAQVSGISEEKRGYFEWRESWIGYENFDSNLDEDEVRRRTLLISAADEQMWRELNDASFIVQF